LLRRPFVVGVILGFIIEQGILKHMYERDEVLIVLATFGLFLVLEDIILIAFGTDPYFAYQPMALLDSVELGGITRRCLWNNPNWGGGSCGRWLLVAFEQNEMGHSSQSCYF
jgi:branched-subunit amino acid ABC-type transport system permease component